MIDAHLIFIIISYLIFALIAVMYEIKNIRIRREIRMISLCKFMYIFLLAIVPALIFCGYIAEGITTYIKYEDRYIWTFYVGLLITVIGYIGICFGYRVKQKSYSEKVNLKAPRILLLNTIYVLISIFSLYLWASGFGGIGELINSANSIRAGFIGSSGNVAFFKHFVPLSMLASLLLFQFLFITKNAENITRKIYGFILFIPAVVISFLFILANDGRMLAGIYIFLFFLLVIRNEYEVKQVDLTKIVIRLVVLLIITVAIIINSDMIFRIIRGDVLGARIEQTNSSFFETLTTEFSFIVTSLQTALISRLDGTVQLTFFNDFINGIFAWLPTSLKPIILPDVWDINTKLISASSYGQAPTDIVAQSIYDLGLVGIVLIPVFVGMFIRKMENIFRTYGKNVFYSTIYIVLGFYLAKGIAYFSLYNIMMNIFFIVVGCIIYWLFSKITIKRGN